MRRKEKGKEKGKEEDKSMEMETERKMENETEMEKDEGMQDRKTRGGVSPFLFHEIPEYGYYLAISALKDLQVPDVASFLKDLRKNLYPVRVQVFDASKVAGWRHIYFATLFALKAFELGLNVSRELELEILTIASCQRQIAKAIERLGLKDGTKIVALLLLAEDPKALELATSKLEASYGDRLSPACLDPSSDRLEDLKALFEISDIQLAAEAEAKNPQKALGNLIIEKMSIQLGRR